MDLGSILSTKIWYALGTGVTGTSPYVNSIAISGSNIYAGGRFTTAGGVSVNNIAVWNASSSSWSALGTGITATSYPVVYSITISGNNVYVGGSFTNAGGVSVNNIAVWNGVSWSALGTGVYGTPTAQSPVPTVYSIAINGNNVYVGGNFTTAGGVVNVNNIAIWNTGSLLWYKIGTGVAGTTDPVVNSIAISEQQLYVGGRFNTAGAVSVNNIAMVAQNTYWYALGTGIIGIGQVEVNSIAISGNNIYVGGIFTTAGAVSVNNIAVWDTSSSSWSELGSGVAGTTYSIAISGGNIYVGGQFTTAGGVNVNNIAMIIGTTWYNIGNILGSSPYVSSVAVDAVNKIYAGGVFTTAGGVAVNNIANYTP